MDYVVWKLSSTPYLFFCSTRWGLNMMYSLRKCLQTKAITTMLYFKKSNILCMSVLIFLHILGGIGRNNPHLLVMRLPDAMSNSIQITIHSIGFKTAFRGRQIWQIVTFKCNWLFTTWTWISLDLWAAGCYWTCTENKKKEKW